MKPQQGQIVEGQITRIKEEAAFIDIGAQRDAVIPRKELEKLDEDRLDSLEEGKNIPVYIYHTPKNKGDVLASIAQALKHHNFQEKTNATAKKNGQAPSDDPWDTITEVYQVDDLVEGTITNIRKYGAFVMLPIGVEGLIHVSEMGEGYVSSPWNVVSPGEKVMVRVIRIEPVRKRVGLSLKQVMKT